ncbi:MAG: hypothetical protein AB7F88_16210 [Pyrinomonadaceae bacterium]
MHDKTLVREVRFLKIYTGIVTLFFVVLLVSAFSSDKKKKFGEIDVERINIVEKDGKLKMVISNKERQHPGIMDGKYFKEREGQRPAGMIFFSEKGDEIGGLIFDGNTGNGQFGSLTFDRFRGDQTIQFAHLEDKEGNYFSGLRLNDENIPLSERLTKMEAIEKHPTKEARDDAIQQMREKGEFLVSRLRIGKDRDKSSIIQLKDAKGRTRIEISVKADGNPKLNFLDENGKVLYALPDDAKKQ